MPLTDNETEGNKVLVPFFCYSSYLVPEINIRRVNDADEEEENAEKSPEENWFIGVFDGE